MLRHNKRARLTNTTFDPINVAAQQPANNSGWWKPHQQLQCVRRHIFPSSSPNTRYKRSEIIVQCNRCCCCNSLFICSMKCMWLHAAVSPSIACYCFYFCFLFSFSCLVKGFLFNSFVCCSINLSGYQ